MAEVTTYPPGAFCWIEVATTDAKGAKEFYSGLFGWETDDQPAYTMLRIGTAEIGGLHQLTQSDLGRGGRAAWLSYVSVPNADDAAARARALGGSVLRDPSDVFDMGRTALIQDPEGAQLALWQPQRHAGARRMKEAGTLCWNELASRDVAKATAFYLPMFGWTPKVSGTGPDAYTELLNGVVPIGGILERGNTDPHWLVYIAVVDCNAAADKAGRLGGRVLHGPMDIPKVGRFAIIADPQGADFAVFQTAGPDR